MNKILMMLALMLITPSYSQKQSYDFREAEIKSRRLIYSQPDSALTIIRQTLNHAQGAHDTVWSNTYNLYGMYHSQKRNIDSSIYYYQKSLPYAEGYPRNKVRSLINLSASYRNQGNYKGSANILEDVIEINKKIKNNTGIAMAYGELASNFTLLGEYDKSVDYLLKAIAILKSEKNTKQLVAIKQKLGNTYLKTGNFKFAIDLYKECLPEFIAIGNDKNYYLTHLNIAEAYIQLKNFNAAKASLKEAAAGLEKFGDKELIGITYAKVGNIERMQGNMSRAIDFYGKAYSLLLRSKSTHILRIGAEYINLLNNSHDHQEAIAIIAAIDRTNMAEKVSDADQMEYHKAKAVTYSATNDDKKAIESYKNTIIMMDSLSAKDKETALEEVQAKFQTELQREKNIALEKHNKALKKSVEAEQRLMLVYIIGSIVALLMILSLLRSSTLRNKLQKEALKTAEAETSLIKQQHEHELELINAQKELIDEKQRELTSKALQMANYQDSLNEIIQKCDTSHYNKISEIKKDLQLLLRQKDYWKQFETRFNSLHPEFNSKLSNRFSNLTKNDIEFCALLKLNLSNKEIASLLQISHESAITKKYRIKKKMEINDDAEFEKLLTELS